MKQRIPFKYMPLLICLVAAVEIGCARPAQPTVQEIETIEVTAAKPVRKKLTLTTTQPGKIEAFEQTPLFSKVAGYVQELLVDIGDTVKKDQLLVRISVPELQDDLQRREALVAQAEAEVKQAEAITAANKAAVETAQSRIVEKEAGIARAEAELERWKSEYARIKELADKGSVTKKLAEETLNEMHAAEATTQEVAATAQSARKGLGEAKANVVRAEADKVAAEARLRVAKTELARAKTMLGYTEIKAPYDGTITRRTVDTGHYVSPATGGTNQPLLVVARTEIVRIFVDVPELEASHVNAGDSANIHVQAMHGEDLTAKVERTSWTLSDSNHSLRAEIDVPNPKGLLRPGMFATVTIQLDERADALTLPMTAIIREGDETFCASIQSGKIRRIPVRLGLRAGTEVEILSGLGPDDLVVLKQPGTLREGQAVQVAPMAK
ncbi:MAG: efflux RND transporter periplasmic adaptor subunit [Planctomycetota bacterium]|nr:efflux RND transporter periplasmic adaptor subunit [Planctomycetota bacterium]